MPLRTTLSMNRATTGRLLLIIFTVCAVLAAGLLYWSAQFRIVSTTPSMDSFPAGSPVLIIDFSQPLAQTKLSLSWKPGVSSSYTISGKRLVINIRSTLAAQKQYQLSVNGITNQQGKAFGNINYTFTAQDILYKDMPSEVQHALLQQQDHNQPPSLNSFTLVNSDTLIAQGLSSLQLQAVKQALFLFGQQQNRVFTTVTIDPSSVQPQPHDPESISTDFGITCTMTIDGTAYAAIIIYHDTSFARLTLLNPVTNVQAYDSGDIDASAL